MIVARIEEGRDPERTRKAILDAAKKLIAQEGSEAVSVSSVARLAGVNRGTAYLHFGDREELLRETIRSVGEELAEIINEASANIDSWEESDDTVMEKISKALHENAQLARVWLSELVLKNSAQSDELWKAWMEGLNTLHYSGNIDDSVDDEVLAVIGLSATFIWPIIKNAEKMSKAKKQQSAERFAQAFDQIVLRGLLKR